MEKIEKGIQKNNQLVKTLINNVSKIKSLNSNFPMSTSGVNTAKRKKVSNNLMEISHNIIKKDTKVLTSFSFKVFFKKTEDEKIIVEKIDKVTAYINSYLRNKIFLDSISKKIENASDTLPIELETFRKGSDDVIYFKFNVLNPIINDRNIGRIIEKIQEKLYQAEELGWG